MDSLMTCLGQGKWQGCRHSALDRALALTFLLLVKGHLLTFL